MIYKKINNKIVSAICYGGGDIKSESSIDSIYRVLNAGVNFFDTSESYYDGMSENILGKTLKQYRKKLFISTKVSPEHLKYNDVINACNQSLKRLQTNYIDLYYVHWPNNLIPVVETCTALEYLLKCGKILNIGFCNFPVMQLQEMNAMLRGRISAVQYEYNFIDRSVEKDIIPFCELNQIAFVAFSPLRYIKYMPHESNFILSWIISHENMFAAMSSKKNEHIDKNLDVKVIDILEVERIKTYFIDLNLIEYKAEKIFSPVIAEDIRKYGILKPIKVIKSGDKYKIIDGDVRFLSWKHVYPEKPIETIILSSCPQKHDENVVVNKNDI